MSKPQSSSTPPDTMTVPEVAHKLGISADAARRQIQRGTFPIRVLRVGSVQRIAVKDYEAFMSGEASR